MAKARFPYWWGFAALTVASLGLLFLFVFGFFPQRFLLELDFAESGFAYPSIRPPLPELPPPPRAVGPRRPIARGPAERFWAEYLTLARAGEDRAALSLIKGFLARYPEDRGVRLEHARALWRLGQLDAAIAAYGWALEVGTNGDTRTELARLLVATRRWDEALSLYRQLVDESRDDLALWREYAELATWAERYDLAVDAYAGLVRRLPDEPTLRLDYARVLYWAGRPQGAAEVLGELPAGFAAASVDSLRAAIANSLPRDHPEAEVSLIEQARGLMLLGAVDSALVLYSSLLSEHPHADTLLLEVADVFEYRANQPDSAMVYLHAYLDRRPEAEDVRLRLARLLAWGGQYDSAQATTLAYLDSRPDDAEAWVLLGDLQRWRGDRKGAREAYRRALQIDPDVAGAKAGLATMQAEVDALLASRGRIGPAGGFDYFADSDDFRRGRLRGAWSGGSPRTRAGLGVTVEELSGFEPTGSKTDMFGLDVQATAERWWRDGGVNVQGSLGAWIPESNGSIEPLVSLVVAVPDWGGSAYRFEYRHEPAYRWTQTMEAAVAGLRADVAGLEFYRSIAPRWDASVSARLGLLSGVGDANLRGDGALSILYRPSATWSVGYETRALGFGGAAPDPGRRLYWDPEWYWLNAGVVDWVGRLAEVWNVGAHASVGAAWIRERDRDAALEAQFAFVFDARRQLGLWTLGGRTGFSQSRTDGYRSFRFELVATRSFGR
jgi:predicted Zn-dependent protease